MNLRLALHGLGVLLSLVAIGFLVKWSGLGNMLDQGWIDTEVRGQGVAGELLFLGVGGLATAVGFPRQVIAFLGGYAFGFLQGVVLGVVATVIGCLLSFYYARMLGRRLVASRLSGRSKRVDDFLRGNPFEMTLLIRLLPVGSNFVTNLAAGVSSVAAAPFVLASALGYVPQTAVFALVGSGIHVDPVWRIGLGVVLFIVSGLLGLFLYRRLRRGRVYDTDLETRLGE
jgi:uncharacterized membrane protein YdjX (TVP38/TMEM64 family)